MSSELFKSLETAFPGAQVMEEAEINWDAIETEGGFEPLPEGNYNLTIEKAEYKATPKGGMQISLTYAVENSKRKIFDNLTVKDYPGYVPGPKGVLPSQIGLGRIKGFLKIAGIDPKEFKFSQAFALTGIKFNGKVKIDTYNPAKPKNKVTSIGAYVEPKVKTEAF